VSNYRSYVLNCLIYSRDAVVLKVAEIFAYRYISETLITS